MQLRVARPDDAAAMQAIYAPLVRETAISFEVAPPTVGEMQERIAHTIPRFPWLVCADGEQICGYAYASRHRERPAYQWSVDVSVYIHAAWRRQGIGHALYTSLFAILRAQGFVNVCAGIALPNPGSVRLHEAMGMQPIGVYRQVGFKLGDWHDVGWWQGMLHALPADPAIPMTLTELEQMPHWEALLATGLLPRT